MLGAVSIPTGRFVWRHQTEYFNALTYIAFLEEVLLPAYYRKGHRVYLIQDNASYPKKTEVWQCFKNHRQRIEGFLLPPYSPEFNATERLWRHTWQKSTHNRFFDLPAQLCQSLFATFREMEKHPETIGGYLQPYF